MTLPAPLPHIVGAKLPLRPMHVWTIRVRLQIERRNRYRSTQCMRDEGHPSAGQKQAGDEQRKLKPLSRPNRSSYEPRQERQHLLSKPLGF